jgi:uroporphyrinogen III methyltransferase/synthase
LLRRADAVVVDALVNPILLRECPSADIHFVGKRGGSMHAVPQKKINALLVRLARSGKRVVRLKGGDPFVFGRGGEEVEALRAAHIPYEIVPGVTSAIAAPAYAGIPVSDRRWSSQVTFFTGHEGKPSEEGSSGVDWSALSPSGTLVVLMGVAEWPSIRRNLLKRGWNKSTPVAAIISGTTKDQRVIATTLSQSEKKFKQQKLAAPAVIVVGGVSQLARTRGWVHHARPLLGRKVVVTRAAHQNETLNTLLEDAGADVIECPAISIRPLQRDLRLREIVGHLDAYDWVVLLSVNAVEAFALLLESTGNALRSTKICAVGPATAHAARERGWSVARTARDFNSRGVLSVLGTVKNKKILLPRVQNGPVDLPQSLRRNGAVVDEVATYETVGAPPPAPAIKKIILNGADAVTFTSASTVQFFYTFFSKQEWATLFKHAVAVSIGPSTTAMLKRFGVKKILQTPVSTVPKMVEAFCRFIA